jgi:hypothetical protein
VLDDGAARDRYLAQARDLGESYFGADVVAPSP